MPHLRNVITTEIEEDKINPYESTHISTPHTSHFKDCSDLSNSPTAFTAGKQDLQDEPTTWVNLSKPLHRISYILPNESGTTYVVTEMETLPTEKFLGAPAIAYNGTVRNNPEKAQEGLRSMMKHSKCTYHHTKGRAPGLK